MSTGPAEAIDLVALYRDQRRNIEHYFARRVRHGEIAADLAAETYLQALRSRDRFAGERADMVKWLYGIAHHVLAAYQRRAQAVDAALLRAPLERDIDGDDDREQIFRDDARPRLRRALRPALNRLPDGQRDAVALRIVDDLSYTEIAARLDINAEAARAHVSRALHALAATLAGTDADTLH